MMEEGSLHGNHSCASMFSTPPRRCFSISRPFPCSSLIAAGAQGDKGKEKISSIHPQNLCFGIPLPQPDKKTVWDVEGTVAELAQLREHPRVGGTKEGGSGGRDELWRGCGCFFSPLWLLQTPGQCLGEFLLWQRWRGLERGARESSPCPAGPRGVHDSSEIKHI